MAGAEGGDIERAVRVLRAGGKLGRRDLLTSCLSVLEDEDAGTRFWAAWSAVLLGDREKALRVLESFVLLPNAFRQRPLRLLLRVLDLPSAQRLLKTIAQAPVNKLLLIQGAGIAGDPQYLPWLIGQMVDDPFARLAGESFSMTTGLDLAYLDLERNPPEGAEFGPSDNPEDDNVAMTKTTVYPGLIQKRFKRGGTRINLASPMVCATLWARLLRVTTVFMCLRKGINASVLQRLSIYACSNPARNYFRRVPPRGGSSAGWRRWDEDAEAIKKTIRGLSGLDKFLDTEGGLVRWHAQF